MKIHHIAFAVPNIEDVQESFSLLGYAPEGNVVDDKLRNVRILFMVSSDGVRIELVAPLNENSPVTERLRESHNASTLYHVCYETDDIEEAIQSLLSKGIVPISDISAAPAIGDRRVCFAFSKASGLIELVEAEYHEQ